jgi:hypothetical protein
MSHHYHFRPLTPLPNPNHPKAHALYAHLWLSLRKAFPEALAVVLLPDQGHILLSDSHPETAQSRLTVCLRTRAPWTEWAAVPPGRATPGRARTLCALRKIALLPEKEGYCDNPLGWKWSSYLDLMGAETDPWVDTYRLQSLLGHHEYDFKTRLHNYVAAGQQETLEALISRAPKRWSQNQNLAFDPIRGSPRTPENRAWRFSTTPPPMTKLPRQRAGG